MSVHRSINSPLRPSPNLVQGAKMKDESWLTHVTTVLQQDTFPKDEIITRSGTLIPDKVASPFMIKHAMQLTMKSTRVLNPGQTGVFGVDQTLFEESTSSCRQAFTGIEQP